MKQRTMPATVMQKKYWETAGGNNNASGGVHPRRSYILVKIRRAKPGGSLRSERAAS
jgi:hypothetical protein